MRIKHFLPALALAVGFGSSAAMAQGVCPMGQPQPTSTTVTSKTLGNGDQCAFYIFTSATPVTVTAPTATSLNNPNFAVMLMSTGAPVTVSASSVINNQTSQTTLSGFQPMWLMGDGTGYWLVNVTPQPLAGQYTSSTQYSNSGTTPYLMPGTTLDNSSVLQMGNGVLKLNNQASWLAGSAPAKLAWNGCGYAPPGWGQGGNSWLMLFDNLGIRRYIPTC